MALVEVEGLRKRFGQGPGLLRRVATGTDVVDGVSLHVEAGETLALVGESGAGKSTVGRLLLRLISPDDGSVRFDGTELTKLSGREVRRRRSRMQMIFQDPYSSLDPKMTIGLSIDEPLRIHTDLGRAARREQVHALLERVGLREDQADCFPHELSGGQLQRAAVARAIATDPDFIVCDEPVAALDVSIRAQIINLLRGLQAERKIAYLFISHDLMLVQAIAHRVAVLYAGRIVETGPAATIFEHPQHPYTRALLAAVLDPDPAHRRPGRLGEDLPVVVGADSAGEGCAYAPRCPEAVEPCRTQRPALRTEDGHGVACHVRSLRLGG